MASDAAVKGGRAHPLSFYTESPIKVRCVPCLYSKYSGGGGKMITEDWAGWATGEISISLGYAVTIQKGNAVAKQDNTNRIVH